MKFEELHRIADRVGFRNREALGRLVLPAAAATIRGTAQPGSIRGSKIGGLPCLPIEANWPRKEGKSLAFLAQVELSEIPPSVGGELPSGGMLSFFYISDDHTWGFDPADKGGSAVLYFPDSKPLRPMTTWPADIAPENRFREVAINFEATLTVAPYDSGVTRSIIDSKAEGDAYFQLEWAVHELEGVNGGTVLLGHPLQIQGDMSVECAFVREGIYMGDGSCMQHPRYEEVQKKAIDWRLLLQLDGVEEAGMSWGDGGYLYFWIPVEALKRRDFAAAWMVLQCH